MRAISCAEMKAIDTYAIEKIGIPSIVLMEHAALKVVQNINLEKMHTFTIVCGTGNNGGDGLAIARQLFLQDKQVDLFIVGDRQKATTDFQVNLNILENLSVPSTVLTNSSQLKELKTALTVNDLTIDAIFGIGLDRPVEGLFKQVIEEMQQASNKILAVDVPSGLNGDSGEVLGVSIQAQQTICFHQMKQGLANKTDYTGEVVVVDIGIPKSVTETILTQ